MGGYNAQQRVWTGVVMGPNNSFKPNALRSTNNMAKQLAMLLAPLRTSA